MFRDFPTLQAIKQVAKCPLGSSPGLVRGRFLSRCGREREKTGQQCSFKAVASGAAWPLRRGGLRLWGRDLNLA